MCVEAQNALRVCCVLIFQALCHLTISGKLSNRNILEHGYSRCRYSSYENRLESLESPYQTFQRFLFVPIGGDLPLRLFRPMAINKFIINHAVMRTKEELL